MDAITREQLAAQAVAMIGGHFSRPTEQETIEILEAAIRQVAPLGFSASARSLK
jgi:hypothetical protein